MIAPNVIRYRKLHRGEFLENWLTAVARELVFSERISENLLMLGLFLKSALRFLLVFLIFQNDPATTPGTVVASICRNNYSSFCLLATSLAQKVYLAWKLVSPGLSGLLVLNFILYLVGSLVVTRADPTTCSQAVLLTKMVVFGAQVFVAICLVAGVLGFLTSWVFVFVHASSSFSLFEFQGYPTVGLWMNLIISISSILVNLFFAMLGFSWRRFHRPLIDKLIGSSDVLEHLCDGLLLFGSVYSFPHRIALGVYAACLLGLYCFRVRTDFPVTWKTNPGLDLANLVLLLVEAAFLTFLTFLGLSNAQFELPNPLLSAILFLVLSPVMSRLFSNLVPFLAKRDQKILDRIWSSMVRPEDISSLILLSQLLAEQHPSNSLMRDPKEFREIDLVVTSHIRQHAQECRVVSCPCRQNTRGRPGSFRDSHHFFGVITAERLRNSFVSQAGQLKSKQELEVFLSYLDFVPKSYEAILYADSLHHLTGQAVEKVYLKLALYACQLRRAQKLGSTDFRESVVRLGLPELLQREYRLKKIGKLINGYFTEFLSLQRVASSLKMQLAVAKKSLNRLYAIELEYLKLFDQFKKNKDVQFLDFTFRTFFQLPQKTSPGHGSTALRAQLANIQEMTRLSLSQESDFQFLLLTVEDHSSLYVARASHGIERTLGYDKHLLLKHSIDFMIPEGLRSAHSQVVQEFFKTGEPQLMTHGPNSFLVNVENDLFPVNLSTQVVLDWLGVKLLVFAKVKSTTKVKATIICDPFGTLLHATRRLADAVGWPEHLEKFEFPFYLFFENGTEKFVDFLTSEELRHHPDPKLRQKSKKAASNFSDKMIVDPNLVAKLRRMMRQQQLARVETSPSSDQVIERVLAHKFRFVRDNTGTSYSYPLRLSYRVVRLGLASFLVINVLEDFGVENRLVIQGKANLFFRMVLLRMFLRLGVKTVTPQRSAAIRKLFTSLFAKRHLALQSHRSSSKGPEPPSRNEESARIASKFHSYNAYEPPFFFWLKLGLFCLGCAIFVVSLVAILWFSKDLDFVSGKVTISFEIGYVTTSLQYLNAVKLLQVCPTSNCTVAALAIQKSAIDWSKSRSKILGNSGSVFAQRDILDASSNLRPDANDAHLNFYAYLTQTLNGIMFMNTSTVNSTDLIYNNVQVMWNNFQPRFLTAAIEGLLVTAMDNFYYATLALVGIGFLLILLIWTGYFLLQRQLNFLIGMIQFFDHHHFAEKNLQNFAHSMGFITFKSEKMVDEDSERGLSEFRKTQKAKIWQLFPVLWVTLVLLAILFLLIWTPFFITQKLYRNTLSPFSLRTVIAKSIMFYTAKGHQILYPSSAVRIDDRMWAEAVNSLTEIAYFGDESYPLSNRTKVVEILSTMCQSTIPKKFPDCNRYFNGVIDQPFPVINSFFINYLQRLAGSFSLNKPESIDLAIVTTIAGIYLRELSVAVQAIGVEQLTGLSDQVLNLIWTLVGIELVLAVAVCLLVLRPMSVDVKASLRIIHFLDAFRAFSNSQVRFFVDELS